MINKMEKKDLKVYIIDKSSVSVEFIKSYLKDVNITNVKVFRTSNELLKDFKKESVDIIFICSCSFDNLNGIELLKNIRKKDEDVLIVMITNSTDINIKQKAIKNKVNEFINTNISFPEFFTKINILINLRLYYYKIKEYEESIKGTIKYKNTQEKMALKKQYKIIKDEVSNHFYGDWLVDSYFKPYDIVSGDSYITIKLSNTEFFVAIVDGMGKGISASLSSVLSIAFLNYSITKSRELDDYSFNRVVRDVFNYIKTIMLEHESLSFALVHIDIKKEKIYYANFGLFPFYLKKGDKFIQIKPNNASVLSLSKNFKIDTYEGFDSLLITSDGLTESFMKDNMPYFVNLKKEFTNFDLLSEILEDFKKEIKKVNDDITVFMISKDNFKYKTIFDRNLLVTKENIEKLLIEIEKLLTLNKICSISIEIIIFALNELLLNILEHSIYKISENKQKIVKNEIKIEYNNMPQHWANLKIKLSKKFILVEIENEGKGFEVNKVLNTEWYNRYHGRGLKMLKLVGSGLYYNSNGNNVKFYIKKEF
jgi:DNA-binding NarL/FixJ family response regulator